MIFSTIIHAKFASFSSSIHAQIHYFELYVWFPDI